MDFGKRFAKIRNGINFRKCISKIHGKTFKIFKCISMDFQFYKSHFFKSKNIFLSKKLFFYIVARGINFHVFQIQRNLVEILPMGQIVSQKIRKFFIKYWLNRSVLSKNGQNLREFSKLCNISNIDRIFKNIIIFENLTQF